MRAPRWHRMHLALVGGRLWTPNLLGWLNEIATTHEITIVPGAKEVNRVSSLPLYHRPSPSTSPSKCTQVDLRGLMGVRLCISIDASPVVKTT